MHPFINSTCIQLHRSFFPSKCNYYFLREDLAKNINADEAAAMGAVYQAANLGKGFKVKAFQIRDSNIFPIQVLYSLLRSLPLVYSNFVKNNLFKF